MLQQIVHLLVVSSHGDGLGVRCKVDALLRCSRELVKDHRPDCAASALAQLATQLQTQVRTKELLLDHGKPLVATPPCVPWQAQLPGPCEG